ncbi:MAG: hypothetical protein KDJ65_36915, partial [Anaerolineae bacterium]|nr:hypothetical protein [Anaerolineae bacterium]
FAVNHPERVIDADRIGYPVDVPQGNYRIQSQFGWPWTMSQPTGSLSRNTEPMQGGMSISNELIYGYGTLGGKVIDRQTGAEMMLSNWHVLVGAWYVRPGSGIMQPGRGDGGQWTDIVARLKRDAMNDFIDGAVAELNGTRPLINHQVNIGPVTGVTAPVPGLRVKKSGRRSGVTQGIITGIEGRQTLLYAGVQRVIRHVVHIAPINDGDQISAKGDSGSWWLDADRNQAVGLHFAGSNTPEYGLAIAMPQVLDALNVDIDTRIESTVSPELRRRQPVKV